MKINLNNERRVRIEMLPLIDVVFLLLVVFIFTMLSMAVHRGLTVDLPESSTAKLDKKLILSVTINSNGKVYVDKEPVSLENLSEVLKIKAEGYREPGVLLFADSSIEYKQLFKVLDRIKMAGLNRISLQAEADEQ